MTVGSTEWALRRDIRRMGGRIPPAGPRVGWISSTLKSRAQVEDAVAEIARCGLPLHPDRPKNWDALSAVKVVVERTQPSARVLEVGATLYSVMLRWLYQFGYRDLHGIDLVYRGRFRRGPIRYEYGDLTRTRFAGGTFAVVCAMSVIEHGVPTRACFAEMARLLRPGGLLVTSTDYWRDPIDTRGQRAFGVPIKIFTRFEMEQMLALARELGFVETGPIDLDCEERAVTWQQYGLDYTFTCFALVRW
jgi:SAM-dependent methyltransferase